MVPCGRTCKGGLRIDRTVGRIVVSRRRTHRNVKVCSCNITTYNVDKQIEIVVSMLIYRRRNVLYGIKI